MAQDLSRRSFLTSLFKAGRSIPTEWVRGTAGKLPGVEAGSVSTRPAAPAGAISLKNLNSKCTACQLCVESCPTHVLRPALSEYGPQGFMHPVLDFRKSYCDFECNKCGQVCPTGAITPLTVDQKQFVQVGIAKVMKSMCLAEKNGCHVCADVCPADAIRMKEDYNRRLKDKDGNIWFPKFPVVEATLCVGCGMCENKCPVTPVSAICVDGLEIHT